MSNTLTNVAPVLYSAARIVPRELTGFLAACALDFDDKGVAKGDSVKVGVSPVMTTASVTPSQTFSAGTDRSFTASTLTLNQFKEVSWNLTSEQEKSLQNSGVAQDLLAQTVQQGIRALINGIESYVATVADQNASRAYGTAATSPFATNLAPLAHSRKILVDNGAPPVDLHAIIDTTAGVDFRGLSNIYKVNERGSDATLVRGDMGEIYGINLHESAQVVSHTAGTGLSYVLNGSHAIGATSIVVKTGTGTILAGDVLTINSVNYVVTAGVAAPGTVTIQEPGLLAAGSDGDTITVVATHTANIVMHRNAVKAVVRPALQPDGAIAEQMVISDDQTGLSFLLLRVPGNAMSSWFLRCVYDAFAPNGFALAKMLG